VDLDLEDERALLLPAERRLLRLALVLVESDGAAAVTIFATGAGAAAMAASLPLRRSNSVSSRVKVSNTAIRINPVRSADVSPRRFIS
jgi:hypothetical protein